MNNQEVLVWIENGASVESTRNTLIPSWYETKGPLAKNETAACASELPGQFRPRPSAMR